MRVSSGGEHGQHQQQREKPENHRRQKLAHGDRQHQLIIEGAELLENGIAVPGLLQSPVDRFKICGIQIVPVGKRSVAADHMLLLRNIAEAGDQLRTHPVIRNKPVRDAVESRVRISRASWEKLPWLSTTITATATSR